MQDATVPGATFDRDLASTLTLRRGIAYWFSSYVSMLLWNLLSLRLYLSLLVIVQLLIGAGFVVGLGFLFEEIPPTQAAYFVTGALVMPLMLLGLVVAPQNISQERLEGTYEFRFTLPVPRMAMYAAGLTTYSVAALPAAVVALVIASWRYGVELSVSPLAVPAGLLVVGVASAVGYALGHGVPNPRVTNLVTQVLVFFMLVFSPINFPAERLPQWLQWLHKGLPMEHAATLMRSTLTEGLVTVPVWPSWLVLGAWALGCWAVTYAVMVRRG